MDNIRSKLEKFASKKRKRLPTEDDDVDVIGDDVPQQEPAEAEEDEINEMLEDPEEQPEEFTRGTTTQGGLCLWKQGM
jgi:hypothetical protein